MIKDKPFIIGLTGGIGSGKTAVSDWFASQGIDVIDADVISRTITNKGSATLQALKDSFGAWILDDAGNLDRVALRQYVFDHPQALTKLNAITHPAIRQEIFAQLAQTSSAYVVLSVPLLLESNKDDDKGWTAICERILVVDVPTDLQIQRASSRDNQNTKHIQAIINKQIDRQTRLSLADDVIDNSGDLNFLYQQLKPLHQRYLAMANDSQKKHL